MPTARRFNKGDELIFHARAGRKFACVVADPKPVKRKIAIQLPGDPFPVMVNIAQLSEGDATVPGSEARDLAKRAHMMGIPGWQKMTLTDLRVAVEERENPSAYGSHRKPGPKKGNPVAKKIATRTPRVANKKTGAVAPRKARAVKKAAKKRAPAKVAKKSTLVKSGKISAKKITSGKLDSANGSNPFRVGSNVWKMAEELLRGGRRADMIKRLKKSMPLHPWSKDKEENPDRAIDKRLLMTAAAMEKDYGYKIVREGRGVAGTIKVLPPGRKAVAKKPAKKARSKATTSGKRR